MWYVHGAFLHPIDFAEAGEKVTATNAATRTRYFIVFSQCWARMKLGHFPSGVCEVVHSAVQKPEKHSPAQCDSGQPKTASPSPILSGNFQLAPGAAVGEVAVTEDAGIVWGIASRCYQ